VRNTKTTQIYACVLALLLLGIDEKISAQGTSTPEERFRWVEITRSLENNPLDESLNGDCESALTRLSEVHDFRVLLCPAVLSEFNGMKYTYSNAITRQYMLAKRRVPDRES